MSQGGGFEPRAAVRDGIAPRIGCLLDQSSRVRRRENSVEPQWNRALRQAEVRPQQPRKGPGQAEGRPQQPRKGPEAG
eukprot:349707-Chlamydomonas_euryale.AAC.7